MIVVVVVVPVLVVPVIIVTEVAAAESILEVVVVVFHMTSLLTQGRVFMRVGACFCRSASHGGGCMGGSGGWKLCLVQQLISSSSIALSPAPYPPPLC